MKKIKGIKTYISIFIIILNIVTLCLFSYSLQLYNGIETFYRIFGLLLLLYFLILLSYLMIHSNKKNKNKLFILYIIITLLFIPAEFIGYNYLTKIYVAIESYSKQENEYSTSLITHDFKLHSYKDIKNKKIGIITDIKDIEGNILPNEVIEKLKLKNDNEIMEYDSTISLLYAFKNKEIDLAFFSSNYIDMFSPLEDFQTIETDTKEIYKETKIYEIKDEIKNENSSFKNPFSVLIIGVDSKDDGVTSGYNADVLLLMTFNPNTLNATLTSVPRDIYLKTACSGGAYRRINTTTWGSASTCAVQTIENMFNVDIDYYAKINFKGVVQLVDALGGIEVDVPYSFCEQNSSRQWGSSTVFVEKGLQTLNGEQTLALSRNRHKPNDNSLSGSQMATYCPTYNEGNRSDYTRGKNQIKIIQGIIQKAAKLKDPNQAIEILEKIEKNFQTNITTNNILSLYDLGKSLIISNNTNLINIKRLQLTGRGVWGLVYEESSKSYPAVTIPYQESINAIKKEININLGKLTQIPIKNISFDLNNPYELEIIGQGNYSNINITTLKDLSKYSVNQIKQYAQSINKELKFIDYDTNQEVFINDYNEYNFHIQKEHKDIILDQINSITIYVKKTNITSTPSE